MTQNHQPPIGQPSSQQPGTSPKDPDTAFLIELVGGFFGLLGLGYMYVGRTEEGVIRLIGWIIYNVIAYITIVILLSVIIGCFCIPIQLAVQVGVSLWSANSLKNSLIDNSMRRTSG